MEGHFHKLRVGRALMLKSIKALSNEQLNFIPKDFNNNIIWNIGHILVTQQLLVYSLSDVTPKISQERIDTFRKGAKPERKISKAEVLSILEEFKNTVDQAEVDYKNGLFKTFKEYPTSYGLTLQSTDDAIIFNNIHEALHLGYILAMKRVITN